LLFTFLYIIDFRVSRWLTADVNSVGIAMGYRLDGRGSILGRDKISSLLHSVQTGSGAHSASYSTGVKRPGREGDHSPPSIAEVKNDGPILPLTRMSSGCGA
jgi:hypothetical protein